MIVFLSSSARPRYADDIIRMLALPRGGQMQFRYSDNWLAQQVRDEVPGEGLAGEYGLVCFVAPSTSQNPFSLIPVRFVRVIRAELVGTSYIFTLAAEAFATRLTDQVLRISIKNSDRERLPSAAKAANELYVLDADFSSRRHQCQCFKAFESTATELSTHAPFATEESAFFNVRRISMVNGRSWFGTWPQPRKVEMGAFSLTAGKRYECEVYCLRLFEHPKPTETTEKSKPLKELALVAEANDDSLQFASARRSVIDSRYDVKRFVFAAEPEVLRRVSGCRFYLSAAGDPSEQARQDISIQMVFGGSLGIALIRAISIGVASAGPAMVAAYAAGNLDTGLVALMVILGMLAGIAAIFPSFRKP